MALVCVFDGLEEVLEYVARVRIVNQFITDKEGGGDLVFEPFGLVNIESVGAGLLFLAKAAGAGQARAQQSLGQLGQGMVLFPSLVAAEERGAKLTSSVRTEAEAATPATLQALVTAAAAATGEELPETWSELVDSVVEEMIKFIASGETGEAVGKFFWSYTRILRSPPGLIRVCCSRPVPRAGLGCISCYSSCPAERRLLCARALPPQSSCLCILRAFLRRRLCGRSRSLPRWGSLWWPRSCGPRARTLPRPQVPPLPQ